jgi:hypothetical protein
VVSNLFVSGIPLPDFQNRPETFPDSTIHSFLFKAGRVDRGIAGTYLDALPALIASFFIQVRAYPITYNIHKRNPVFGASAGAGSAAET